MKWSSIKATEDLRVPTPPPNPKPPWKLESLSEAENRREDRISRLRRQLAKLGEADQRRKPIQNVLKALGRVVN